MWSFQTFRKIWKTNSSPSFSVSSGMVFKIGKKTIDLAHNQMLQTFNLLTSQLSPEINGYLFLAIVKFAKYSCTTTKVECEKHVQCPDIRIHSLSTVHSIWHSFTFFLLRIFVDIVCVENLFQVLQVHLLSRGWWMFQIRHKTQFCRFIEDAVLA